MSGGTRYLTGLGLVGAAALASGRLLPDTVRPGWWLALGTTLAIQGPLGWWLMRSLGSERFILVWVLGMLVRFGLVALFGLVVVPALGWPAAPVLLSLVGFLVVSLAIEGIVAALQTSRALVR